MSRLSYVGVLLSVAFLVQSLAAQDRAITDPAMVQHVLVRDKGEGMEVEIQTSGAAGSPETQAIPGPDRIVVDFPGTLPSSNLRAMQVNKGRLKAIRSGLFFNDPSITRIGLDLSEPRAYQISTLENAIVVKLGPASAVGKQVAIANHIASPRLRDASLTAGPNVPAPRLSAVSVPVGAATRAVVPHASISNANLQSPVIPTVTAPQAPKSVNVPYENGMLRIRAEKVTLAQVLFEVHLRTQAEIAIPAGAEQERVVADLGPAPARDVLAALLNGSAYNFIFIGEELSLQRVILTRRAGNF